jgi:hypothetical protein
MEKIYLKKKMVGVYTCGHGCEADFVIVHSGDVECASCGTSYGRIVVEKKPIQKDSKLSRLP